MARITMADIATDSRPRPLYDFRPSRGGMFKSDCRVHPQDPQRGAQNSAIQLTTEGREPTLPRLVSLSVDTVDHYQVLPGVSVGGATTKDVLVDPASGDRFIAKLGGRNSDVEVFTEYAIYLIGRTLSNVVIADAKIAVYKGQLRFLSKIFLDSTKAQELVHGMQLFKELYDDTTVEGVVASQGEEQSFFRVQAIKAAFGAHYYDHGDGTEDELFDAFVSMLTHDALVGVMDRHHENWGVIVERDVGGAKPRFAPLYDSARGLFCHFPDTGLRQFEGRAGVERLNGYIGRARPLVGFLGIGPTDRRSYLTHFQLLAAVFWQYSRQRPRITAILESYDWRSVREALRSGLPAGCSPHRISLMLACLRRRLRTLNRAIHGSDV